MRSKPALTPPVEPIVPMAHGDLHRLTVPHLLRVLPVKNGQRPRVLDLGAGSGSMTQLLHDAGYSVEACDLEPALFQFTAVACRQADFAEPLPYDSASFDAVVCVEVLEHLDAHQQLFEEVERLLKPDGVFLFTTPNVMSIKSRLSFLWTGFEHSFYPLDTTIQTPQEWHISGHGGNRYRFVLGLAGLELQDIGCDKQSRSSLAFAWLIPLIKLRTWLRYGRQPGAVLNNSLAALLGRSMIGIARKPGFPRSKSTACLTAAGQPLLLGDAEAVCRTDRLVASNGTPLAKRQNRLSIIIPCKNEREQISACIASAQRVADEVLVADSGSTDGTLEIARKLGCRIIERKYGTSGDFKNWAIPQAAHEWVLILDADERLTPELAAEINEMLSDPRHDGYWIYRRNHFLGHPIRFGLWKNDRCLRLFRRDLGRYVGPTDHAEVELSGGTVGRLRQRMTHYTCTSYAQYLPKLDRYAEVQARVWNERGRRASLANLLFRFPLRFLQGYVWRLGFLDGLAGLQVCVLVAYLSYLKHAYLWQLQQTRDWRELEQAATDQTTKKSTDRSAA
jgi:SAM-dependent methyltransferase